MTCGDVRNNLQVFLDGELDCLARRATEYHLSCCSECRTFIEEQRAAHTAMTRATCDCARPPSNLSARAFKKLDQNGAC